MAKKADAMEWLVEQNQSLLTRAIEKLAAADRRADRILDAYHQSYRHGPDPDPKVCPACHAAMLEDE